MSRISLEQVKKLREETGVGVMVCREVLEKSNGDFSEAKKLLAERTTVKVGARADRETAAGIIVSYIHGEGRVGALLEFNSETDFVSRGDVFRNVAREVAMQICAMDPESVDDLLGQDWIRDSSQKVGDLISKLQSQTKENIVVKRFCRFEVGKT